MIVGIFFSLRKQKPFSDDEHRLVKNIMDECFERDVVNDPFRDDISKGIIESSIAKFLGGSNWAVIKSVIDVYNSWSSQTYEGNRICHNVGIELHGLPELFSSKFHEFKKEDYIKILGSSQESLLKLSIGGAITGLESIPRVQNVEKVFAPISMAHISMWATGKRIAISLTRNGEILIFKNSSLCFAQRRGNWRYFPHELMLRESIQITGADIPRETRVAVYLTALDVAFTRGGACIGILHSNKEIDPCIPTRCQLQKNPGSLSVYTTVVKNKKFHELSRYSRAELCAIDGATVIDPAGNIACVGAILTTDGNIKGGGRSAAAQKISDHGIGIKISNDGYAMLYPYQYNTSYPYTTEWA